MMKNSSSSSSSSSKYHSYQHISYERIPSKDVIDKKKTHYKWYSVIAALLALTMTTSYYYTTTRSYLPPPPLHKQPIFTLLKIKYTNGTLVYALDNPIYQQLGQAQAQALFTTTSNTSISKQLTVSKTKLQTHDSLTVTLPNNTQLHNIVILQCSTLPNMTDPVILEAATVEQVGTTWQIHDFGVTTHEYCRFALIQDTTTKILSVSPTIQITSVTTPRAIHLSYTNNPSSMMIRFSTAVPGTPMAVLLLENGKEIKRFQGTSKTYTNTDLCGAPANITSQPGHFQSPGQLHQVQLEGLQPNTRYHYKVGLAHGQGTTWNDEPASFVTALPAGDPTPFTYIMYGDQGAIQPKFQGLLTASLVEQYEIPKYNVTSVHHVGDLAYANGASHVWEAWMDLVEPFAKQIPLMIGVGNHEYDHIDGGEGKDPSGVDSDSGYMPIWGNFGDDSGGECGVPTSMRFTMPESKDSNGVYWYSYDTGLLHTTVISSEHDLSPGSVQYEWLRRDLARVDRKVTPWVIIESHRPLYEGEAVWPNNAVGIAMRYEIEDLLFDYKVDAVFSGHYHSYHRTCDGLYRNQCDAGGPLHLTVGTAGAHLDDSLLFENDWSANFIKLVYGYTRVTVQNATHLHFEFVQASLDENGTATVSTEDDFWVTRPKFR